MHAPVSIQIMPPIIMPGDSAQVIELKRKLSEVITRLDEVYRLLRADVEIIDFREPPPHPSISHSVWKFREVSDNLELWHKQNNIWVASAWRVRG